MDKVNLRVMKAIRNSKGRFFGLYTKQGESLNAQLQSETDQTIVVYDRNFNRTRRFSKAAFLGCVLLLKNLVRFFKSY
jgi:hypothetical protein